MERRQYEAAEIRAETTEEGSVLVGHAAVFDTLSLEMWGMREKIAPGAFTETLGKDDIRALWNHDTTSVLGRKQAGTLSLIEDETGLAVRIDVPDTQVGRDAVVSIERGDVSQMSFGFRVLGDSWTTDDESDMLIRTVEKVQLYEVSPVTFPAYPATDIDVRDFEGALESLKRAKEAAKPKHRPRLMRAYAQLVGVVRG
jgi:HK97 family phage prohead protease